METVAVFERAIEGALGDEHAQGHAGRRIDPLEDLGCVGQLRDHLRANEARHLHALETGPGQRVDRADLGRGGNQLGFILEAVSRSDLSDPNSGGDICRQSVHRRVPPRLTIAYNDTGSPHTIPECWQRIINDRACARSL